MQDSSKKVIADQIRAWRAKNLITEDTADSLLIDIQTGSQTQPFIQRNIIKIISSVGGILIGLGILLFVASNWSKIPVSLKVVLIYLLVLSLHAAALFIKKRLPGSLFANIFHLIATFAFAGGLFLLGQIFHVSAEGSSVFLYIALGSIPLAYAVSSRPIMSFGLIAFYLGLGAALTDKNVLYSFYPIIFTSIGVFVYCLGTIQEKLKVPTNLPGAFKNIGSLTVIATLLVASFSYSAPKGMGAISFSDFPMELILIVVLGIAAFAGNVYFAIVKADKISALESIGFLILLLFVFMQNHIQGPSGSYYRMGSVSTFSLYTFVANITLIISLALFFADGVLQRSKHMINIALLGIVVTIIFRYIDFFAPFLDRSVAFILGGIILLIIGYFLEKERKKIYKQFNLE